MAGIDPTHHVLRHIKKSWTQGDFVEPMAFRLRTLEDGGMEEGLSVNWMESLDPSSPVVAVQLLTAVFAAKGRKVGGQSKFARLKVAAAIAAASVYVAISIQHDPQPEDQSHALVTGYGAFNDQVAEALSSAVDALLPVRAV